MWKYEKVYCRINRNLRFSIFRLRRFCLYCQYYRSFGSNNIFLDLRFCFSWHLQCNFKGFQGSYKPYCYLRNLCRRQNESHRYSLLHNFSILRRIIRSSGSLFNSYRKWKLSTHLRSRRKWLWFIVLMKLLYDFRHYIWIIAYLPVCICFF